MKDPAGRSIRCWYTVPVNATYGIVAQRQLHMYVHVAGKADRRAFQSCLNGPATHFWVHHEKYWTSVVLLCLRFGASRANNGGYINTRPP